MDKDEKLYQICRDHLTSNGAVMTSDGLYYVKSDLIYFNKQELKVKDFSETCHPWKIL